MGQVLGGRRKMVMQQRQVFTGIEELQDSGFAPLKHGKVGIITNATGVFQDMRHLVDVIHTESRVHLVAIFGPEHGFRGAAQAGSSEGFVIDPKTKLPVYDIYMKNVDAIKSLLENLAVDILLFDIQDVGARFYTYIWTLYDCMAAAATAKRKIKFVVADRPNPVGGAIVDGPLLDAKFASFVGRKAIVLRHGMTVGELAQLFNAEFLSHDAGKQVELEVARIKGWERNMLFKDTGLLWVPPSPNMPSPMTALFYLGMALFEGTNCSEGRGTTLPFEEIGAPWIDYKLIESLRQQQCQCPGVYFREASFTPSFSKFSSNVIYGAQVHVYDVAGFHPLRTAMIIMSCLCKLYPQKLSWRKDGGVYWLDKLTGNSSVREALDEGASPDEIIATWQNDITWFNTMRQKYLLY